MKMLSLILFVLITTAYGQIEKVEQTVFGMDCAPCAYGLEGSLKRLEGVNEVKVSLNEGKAYLALSSDNNLTLNKIQQQVKDNGFSARDAEITLKGVLLKEDNSITIKVNDTENYLVSEKSDSKAFARVKKIPAGTLVEIKGSVKKEKEGADWTILLAEIQ